MFTASTASFRMVCAVLSSSVNLVLIVHLVTMVDRNKFCKVFCYWQFSLFFCGSTDKGSDTISDYIVLKRLQKALPFFQLGSPNLQEDFTFNHFFKDKSSNFLATHKMAESIIRILESTIRL